MLFVLEVLAALAALAGGAVLVVLAIPSFNSAPVMGALAAVAVGIAVIPYCFVSLVQRSAARSARDRDPPA